MTRATPLRTVPLALCLAAACGNQSSKKPAEQTAAPSEPAAAPAAQPATSPGPIETPTPPAQLDHKPLVDALGKPDLVLARADGAGVAWAVAKDADADGDETGVARVFCLTKAGLRQRELHLGDPGSPAGIGTPPGDTVDDAHLELVDLDGDGVQEAVLVVDFVRYWSWTPPELDDVECENGCYLSSTEEVSVLYVLTTDAGVALAHAVGYETSYSAAEEIDTYPDPEKIAYEHTVTPGKPAAVELKRTAYKLSKGRPKHIIQPDANELFRAGAGARLEI